MTIRGALSNILSPETTTRMLKTIKNSRLDEVTSGRSVPLDAPEGFLKAAREFLAGQPRLRQRGLEMSGETPYIIADQDAREMTAKPLRKPLRTNRVEARISPDALTIVKRAAEIQGRSISDFIIAAAQDAAQRTIAETHIIRLSVEDQQALAESLLRPPKPSPALRRARDAHKRLIARSR